MTAPIRQKYFGCFRKSLNRNSYTGNAFLKPIVVIVKRAAGTATTVLKFINLMKDERYGL